MIIFDIETNGLLNDVTEIHCLVCTNTEDKTTVTYSDTGQHEPVVRGVQYLMEADCVAGHNIIGYDLPVIRKLFPWAERTTGVVDTLLLSRLIHPDLLEIDKKRKWRHMPLQLYGRHSLEAYGHRLGEYKGDFGKHTDWKTFTPEMEEYCKQDVIVTTKLCKHFVSRLNGYN